MLINGSNRIEIAREKPRQIQVREAQKGVPQFFVLGKSLGIIED